MTKKYFFVSRAISLWGLSLFSLAFVACDPCRQVYEKTCNCYKDAGEIRRCVQELNLSETHKYFENTEPKICVELLKDCTCPQLINRDYSKCGRYRPGPEVGN